MFRTFAAVLFGLSLLMTEQVLAFCPNPLTPDSMCCTYAGPNGTTDNRLAVSLKGCLADVQATNSLLVMSPNSGCRNHMPLDQKPGGTVSFPAIPVETREYVGDPIAPSVPNGEWRQPFSHVYFAMYLDTRTFPPRINTYKCADLSGHLRWVTPPPPISVACVIPDLLPKPTDACSVALEAGFGAATPAMVSACPPTPVLDDLSGEPCLRRKLGELGIAYAGPSSTYRTTGYQKHIADVWARHQDHTRLIIKPDVYQACAGRRAIVLAEQQGPPPPGHRLGFEPIGTSHSGNAFDVDGAVIDALKRAVPFVQPYLDSPSTNGPACNLEWGGVFGDNYHFTKK